MLTGEGASEFQTLVNQVCQGDRDAAVQLVNEFAPFLKVVIRSRLSPGLRRQLDTSDTIQQVWMLVFKNPESLVRFRDPEALKSYLTRLTRNIIITNWRRSMAGVRRDDQYAFSLEEVPPQPSRDPTPSDQVIQADQFRQVVDGQRRRDQRILEMARIGYSYDEIAAELAIHVSTVRRVLQRIARMVAVRESLEGD